MLTKERGGRFVHPFRCNGVRIWYPIYDGMFCPVTVRDAVLSWDSTDTESPFWELGPIPGLSSMRSQFVTA